jgi:SAM-dependent methyltransferase
MSGVTRLFGGLAGALEGAFRAGENARLSRGNHLALIPGAGARRGGTKTYIEWGWTIGLFQSLIFHGLPQRRPAHILDVGCGVGRLAIASKLYLMPGDTYTGFDVNRTDVEFCRAHYADEPFSFLHFEAHNQVYAAGQSSEQIPWPVATAGYNVLTALSIWTHLNEGDARYYLKEVSRVLAPGGTAIITFFVLDDLYDVSLPHRSERQSRFYPQPQTKWIFDVPLEGSRDWFYPNWAKLPEEATAIRKAAFDDMVAQSGLVLEHFYPGSWKEQPGFFFQDVAIFRRP